MSDYTKTTNFTAKDSLPSGNPGKLVKGSDFDTEFNALQTAVNSKADDFAALTYTTTLTSDAQAQLNTKAPIASPTFTGIPTAPTPAVSDDSTTIATTAFVQDIAFNTALPDQTGNSGKFVTTNGTTASWVSLTTTQDWITKTANYTAANGERIAANTSGGAFTVTLPATPSTGHYVEITDGGSAWATNALTIARNGSTIMGLSEDMTCSTNNDSFGLVYNGSTWRLF